MTIIYVNNNKIKATQYFPENRVEINKWQFHLLRLIRVNLNKLLTCLCINVFIMGAMLTIQWPKTTSSTNKSE